MIDIDAAYRSSCYAEENIRQAIRNKLEGKVSPNDADMSTEDHLVRLTLILQKEAFLNGARAIQEDIRQTLTSLLRP